MDWNRIQGNWKQAQGQIKEKWGKLTDDDLTVINGRREQLEHLADPVTVRDSHSSLLDELKRSLRTAAWRRGPRGFDDVRP